MKKISLVDIKMMNDVNLEKDQMNQFFGGRNCSGGAGCTLDTITVTPSGNFNDGDDSWDGECGNPPTPPPSIY